MKAAVYTQRSQPLVLQNLPAPEPARNQLLVRVRAVGICGSDLHAAEAEWTPEGIVMGHEFAGEVVAVGEGVDNWDTGDRVVPMVNVVCGDCPPCLRGDFGACEHLEEIGYSANHTGAYAEYITVSAANALRLPDNISFNEAALIEPLAVGYDAMRRAGLTMEDRVLVIGAGPVGLAITQWCRHFGITDIGVSELNPKRLERARDMGATQLIDGNRVDDPAAEFERLCGRPPNVIVEAVGAPGMMQRCISIAPRDGRIVMVGICMQTDSFEPIECFQKRLSVVFPMGYLLEDFAEILKLMGQGRIIAAPLVSHEISLEELPDMFERLKRPTDQIKVIVHP